ncbi:MAG: hypothetical protein [Bacteriophage sp.]|nr:MAG: hypothetical protein [Bacteriophage sp.]
MSKLRVKTGYKIVELDKSTASNESGMCFGFILDWPEYRAETPYIETEFSVRKSTAVGKTTVLDDLRQFLPKPVIDEPLCPIYPQTKST